VSKNGVAVSAATSPFAALLRIELARAFRGRHAAALAALAVMGVVLAFWLPRFPESVREFFARILRLPTWPEIVVANELVGIVFFVFWIGAFDVFAIYVAPREERQLDLYLAKPLSRRQYMLARLIPVMVTMALLSGGAVLILWLVLPLAGLTYPALPFVGASAVIVGWTACLVAITHFATLSARETYSAALIAFIVIGIALLPGSLYIYRPDLFAEAPLFRAIVIFPLTLLWHPDFTAQWGVPLASVLIFLTIGLIAASGWRVARRDVD
jgi:ABC-type Na+ efflux pump permease subunit